jgi:hypothetical protein
MLWVWGDNLGISPFWSGIVARQYTFRAYLVKAGGVADKLLLPDAGLKGNIHMMMMMDRNSVEIAALIQRWLYKQGLMKP